MTEKELDQLFKQKLGAAQAQPFNPANWQAMEKMLDAQPKTYLPFWRAAAAILGFGLLAGAALLWQNQLPANNTAPQAPVVQSPVEPTPQRSKAGFGTNIKQEQNSPRTKELSSPAAQDLGSQSKSVTVPQVQGGSKSNLKANPGANATPPVRPNQFLAVADVAGLTPLGLALFTPTSAAPSSLIITPTPKSYIKPVKPSVLARYQDQHEFFITGGPSANTSYSASQSAGWNAGIGYRYRVSNQMALVATALYNRTGDMGLLIETDSVFFGFGRTEVNTQKHYKSIGSLRFPLGLEYQPHPAHTVSVGAYADVPLTVSMDLTRTTETFKGATDVEEHSNSKQRPEFNPVNYGLQMTYFYQVYPQLSIGLQVNYGLSDLTNNQHQHFEHNHRLLQTDLTLRYRLF